MGSRVKQCGGALGHQQARDRRQEAEYAASTVMCGWKGGERAENASVGFALDIGTVTHCFHFVPHVVSSLAK